MVGAVRADIAPPKAESVTASSAAENPIRTSPLYARLVLTRSRSAVRVREVTPDVLAGASRLVAGGRRGGVPAP